MPFDISKILSDAPKVAAADKRIIAGKIYAATDSLMDFTTVPNIVRNQEHIASSAILSEVTQPSQSGYVAKGTLAFTPNAIMQRGHEVMVDVNPSDLINQWLGFLTDHADKVNADNFPFTRWFMTEHLVPKINEEREMLKIWNGVYAAPTAGTAGTAGSCVDGLNKQITDGLAAGAKVPVNELTGVGALVAATAYTQVKTAVAQIPEYYRYVVPMRLYLSPSMYDAYHEGRQNAVGTYVNLSDARRDFLPNTNIELRPLPAMVGANRFFITVRGNLQRLVDSPEAINIRVEYAKKTMSFLGSFDEAYGFATNALVWSHKTV